MEKNLMCYLFATRDGRRFMVVAANINDAINNAQLAAKQWCRFQGLSGSLPGVKRHVLATNGVNQ